MVRFVIALAILGLCLTGCEPPHPGPPSPSPNPPGPGPNPGPNPPGPGPNPGPNPPGPDDRVPMDEIGGTIKKIIDGDTVTAKIRGTLLPVTVHLFGIDAPELDQKWGERSKGYLEHLISETSKSVTFQIVQSNGRRSKVAWMRLQNGFVFNYEAVRLGWAWEKDSGDDELILLQEQAQKHSYGMWADTTKEEPWVWRADQGITEEEDKGVHESTNSAGIGVPRPIADP